jgi:hypothetical protein
MTEHARDSPKVNVFCALSANKVCGPFFFAEQTITGPAYLDMVELWSMPQREEDRDNTFFFRQDGAPPQLRRSVTQFLGDRLPGRWTCRGEATVWPPWSPDLTPVDFFLGDMSSRLSTPSTPMPQNLCELQIRIRDACELIGMQMSDVLNEIIVLTCVESSVGIILKSGK